LILIFTVDLRDEYDMFATNSSEPAGSSAKGSQLVGISTASTIPVKGWVTAVTYCILVGVAFAVWLLANSASQRRREMRVEAAKTMSREAAQALFHRVSATAKSSEMPVAQVEVSAHEVEVVNETQVEISKLARDRVRAPASSEYLVKRASATQLQL